MSVKSNGDFLSGQYHEPNHDLARDGRVPKRLVDAPIHAGMRDREATGHPLLAGQRRPLDALPNTKLSQTRQNEPPTFGMGDHNRNLGSKVLADATHLGVKPSERKRVKARLVKGDPGAAAHRQRLARVT